MDDAPTPARVLNPTLYDALRRRFGRVLIANQGAAAAPTFPSAFATRDGKTRIGTSRTAWGEYYRVCCPYCRDGNYHLWVNHLYGTRNESGFCQDYLALCYKGECLQRSPAARKEFYETVLGLVNKNARGQVLIHQGEEVTGTLQPVTPPGEIAPLTSLPPDHQAIRYLIGRGFDPAQLERDYGVGLVYRSSAYPITQGRIYIPLYVDGQLITWQARYPAELVWKDVPFPKYWNRPCAAKSLFLYNWPVVRLWPFICICEGITSAWRIGGCGVPLLGKSLSVAQRQLFREVIGRPLLLMIESGAEQSWEATATSLRQDGHQTVIPVVFPEKFDPADYAHDVVVNAIRGEAAKHNLNLPVW